MTLQASSNNTQRFARRSEKDSVNGRHTQRVLPGHGAGADLADVSSGKGERLSRRNRPVDSELARQTQRPARVLSIRNQSRVYRRISPAKGHSETAAGFPAIYLLAGRISATAGFHGILPTKSRSSRSTFMVRTLLLLMYGAALRTSEALSLTIEDVDLADAVLTVRDSKFFKSRLVPLGPNRFSLADYAKSCARRRPIRKTTPPSSGTERQADKDPHPHGAFQQLREHAGLRREGGPRCQPRLHDLRHTSAVHRLTSWYREGKDVQNCCPSYPFTWAIRIWQPPRCI